MNATKRPFTKTDLPAPDLTLEDELSTKFSPKSLLYTTVSTNFVPKEVPSDAPLTLVPELDKYVANGYGHYTANNKGIPIRQRLDLMEQPSRHKSEKKPKSLLHFFSISDIHITDKESPTQAIQLAFLHQSLSAYSGVMLYTTQVLNATVKTINTIHKARPVDFGISLGDTCNNTQQNETQWYINILNGGDIEPSSGDHVGAATIDYQKPYKAPGLGKIPWYQVIGNHDKFWMGTNVVSQYIKDTYVGSDILKMGDIFKPGGINERDYYMGVLDCNTPNGNISGAGLVTAIHPQTIKADESRRSLSSQEWMGEFIAAGGHPAGHGFQQKNIDNNFASYSFKPKSNIPIKVIVLDVTQKNNDLNENGYGHGTLDKERYNWLVQELEDGQNNDQLMIIAAHIPIGVEAPGSLTGWRKKATATQDGSYVSEAELIDKLHSYPNFILWMAGHRHVNIIKAFKSPAPVHPELGFWQVETASLRDFPQQFRTFEIFRNSDNTLSILTLNVDPLEDEAGLVAKSRSYAIGGQQIWGNGPFAPTEDISITPTSFNEELLITLSSKMQKKLQKCK